MDGEFICQHDGASGGPVLAVGTSCYLAATSLLSALPHEPAVDAIAKMPDVITPFPRWLWFASGSQGRFEVPRVDRVNQ